MEEKLVRGLGLLGLVATGVCTVIGGGINVLTVMIQKEVPGVMLYVPHAFLLGAIPAIFSALTFCILSSAMPKAGGSYIYISRGLSPFFGFIATFSQWVGLITAVGVIAYAKMFLLADAFHQIRLGEAALRSNVCMIGIPLLIIWLSWLLNVLGIKIYEKMMIILMFLMFLGGIVLIFTGFFSSKEEFIQALLRKEEFGFSQLPYISSDKVNLANLLRAAAVLFFAYLGFDALAQAGEESKRASYNLPLAFIISAGIIIIYYGLFSFAIYNAIPWQYISYKAEISKITAPGLMAILWPKSLAFFILLMAALALANDIPPLQLATSRLIYAWTKDGVFPQSFGRVCKRFKTPDRALTLGAIVSSIVVIECHFHGFFLGADLATIALLFTYFLVAIAVLTLPYKNPIIYKNTHFIKNDKVKRGISFIASLLIFLLLIILIEKDPIWKYDIFSSSLFLWAISLFFGASIFFYHKRKV